MSTKSVLRLLRYFHALLGFVLSALVVYIVVNSFVVTTYRVDGESMMPTLQNRDPLLINLQAYLFQPPQRNDVVIVSYEGDTRTHFVKRVVGVPGDTVEFQGNSLVLPADQYFVMGDNRDHSTDSRAYGPITGKHIIGKVIHDF